MSAPALCGVALFLVLSGLMALPGMRARAEEPSVAPTVSASQRTAEGVEQLRGRAAAFWAARVAGDTNGQWELLEPRGRGRLTAGEYAAGRGAVKYIAYQVEDATVNGYFASVKVRLLVQPILPTAQPNKIGPSGTVVADRWVRVGGTWYRSLEQESPAVEASQP